MDLKKNTIICPRNRGVFLAYYVECSFLKGRWERQNVDISLGYSHVVRTFFMFNSKWTNVLLFNFSPVSVALNLENTFREPSNCAKKTSIPWTKTKQTVHIEQYERIDRVTAINSVNFISNLNDFFQWLKSVINIFRNVAFEYRINLHIKWCRNEGFWGQFFSLSGTSCSIFSWILSLTELHFIWTSIFASISVSNTK